MNSEEQEKARDRSVGLDMAYFSAQSTRIESVSVAAGSDLDSHAGSFTDLQEHLNPTYVAWRAIASASEHAGFAEFARFASRGGVVARPNGSLARAALLGAAKAIYLLSPDDPGERVVRAARLANTEAADAERMIQNWGAQDNPVGTLGNLVEQSQDLATEAARILMSAGVNGGSKINETELLKAAVAALPVAPFDSEVQALTLWNRLSGVAHSRAWTWSVPTGVVPREDFVETWYLPVVLLAEAWRLWNLRRGASSTPHSAPDYWEPDPRRWLNGH